MRCLLAILLFSVSFSAQAVDITLTLTTAQATRAASACGKIQGLVNAQKVPRVCTMAEAKTWLIMKLRELVFSVERIEAVEAISAPSAFDPS